MGRATEGMAEWLVIPHVVGNKAKLSLWNTVDRVVGQERGDVTIRDQQSMIHKLS
jgi:hypothetical protein